MIRYPRRFRSRKEGSVIYWEQANINAKIMYHSASGASWESLCDTPEELLRNKANGDVVETFDHHFPRYFEERASRGIHHRRKYTSNTHAVWADGVAPENNLCRVDGSPPHGGAYATLDAAIASGEFIETDGNGVALDGSDEHARRINEQLEAEAFAKDKVNDELRGALTRADVEVGTLRKEIENLKAAVAFAEQSSLYSGRTLAAIRNERDELQKKYENATSYSKKLDDFNESLCKVFYAVGPYAPIVPGFIRTNEPYGSAAKRLAEEYVMLRNERDTLRNNAERSQCAGHYATIQYDRLRYAINDIVKFSRRNPSETDLDVITRVFNERDALKKTIQNVKDELK